MQNKENKSKQQKTEKPAADLDKATRANDTGATASSQHLKLQTTGQEDLRKESTSQRYKQPALDDDARSLNAANDKVTANLRKQRKQLQLETTPHEKFTRFSCKYRHLSITDPFISMQKTSETSSEKRPPPLRLSTTSIHTKQPPSQITKRPGSEIQGKACRQSMLRMRGQPES